MATPTRENARIISSKVAPAEDKKRPIQRSGRISGVPDGQSSARRSPGGMNSIVKAGRVAGAAIKGGVKKSLDARKKRREEDPSIPTAPAIDSALLDRGMRGGPVVRGKRNVKNSRKGKRPG